LHFLRFQKNKDLSNVFYWGKNHVTMEDIDINAPKKIEGLSSFKFVSLCVPVDSWHGFGITGDHLVTSFAFIILKLVSIVEYILFLL
jgi:hypothetical protein